MAHALDRYRKTGGDGSTQASRIELPDWNGLVDEVGNTLASLQKQCADFGAIGTVAIGVLLDRVNSVLGPAYDDVEERRVQLAARIAQLTGAGVSADAVLDTLTRVMVSPAQRDAIATNTAGIAANASAIAAITGGADPLLDTFVETLARFAADESTISSLMTGLGNRLRVDQAMSLSDLQIYYVLSSLKYAIRADTATSLTSVQKAQALANLGITNALGGPADLVFTFGSTPQPGTMKANGAAVSRTVYGNLFGNIGTYYGAGDGSTTFNLPDVRGWFFRAFDDGRGIDASRVLGSYQDDAFQSHIHPILFYQSTGGGTQAANAQAVNSAVGTTGTPLTDGINGTPRTAAETRPKNIALLACIRY